jgi:UDP-glucose 4-epimerase
MDVEIAPEFAPQRKVNPVPRRLADIRRAKSLLGFTAQVSLDDGLRELVAWWRRQQAEKGVSA